MFVWRLWCCFAVFVALFLDSLVLLVINRGCDVFFRVLLLFLCFVCEIAVDNLFDIFPKKIIGVAFLRLDAFCNVFAPRLHLLRLFGHHTKSFINFLCVLLLY